MAKQPGKWTMAALLRLALERHASDLHLKAGRPPVLRIDGRVVFTEFASLEPEETESLAQEVMDDALRRSLAETGGADFSRMLESGERFRLNVFRQRGWVSVAARHVTRGVPDFGALHLPEATMAALCERTEGLVVFAGVTGCGKSTTAASCVNRINQRRACHVVTVEDPIEYVFEDAQAFVNQREVGTDVASFETALRYLMREDPDVILVGETRDRASCEGMLRAVETGHLVLTTLHAPNAPGAVIRILDLFSERERPLVRESLASNLVAVVGQKLVTCSRRGVGRIPATEVLLSTPTVREMLRQGGEERLGDVIAAGAEQGMHDFTQDLARLVLEDWVDPRMAYEVAPSAEALKMAIRGIKVERGILG